MLAQLRYHANSWIIKTVLGLIIFSFVLFFGYSSLSSRYEDARNYVAVVGGKPILRKKFDIHYQATRERMKESIKGNFPENMEGFLRQNVMNQLISRELLTQYAQVLGFSVSDEELAKTIREDKNIFPDGKFDLITYEDRFLPYYKKAYGENYEDVLSRQLLIDKLQAFSSTLFSPWNQDLETSLNSIHADIKKKQPETKPATSTSMDTMDLFSLWLNHFREKIKIEVLEKS